jgi:hypothetical protein
MSRTPSLGGRYAERSMTLALSLCCQPTRRLDRGPGTSPGAGACPSKFFDISAAVGAAASGNDEGAAGALEPKICECRENKPRTHVASMSKLNRNVRFLAGSLKRWTQQPARRLQMVSPGEALSRTRVEFVGHGRELCCGLSFSSSRVQSPSRLLEASSVQNADGGTTWPEKRN